MLLRSAQLFPRSGYASEPKWDGSRARVDGMLPAQGRAARGAAPIPGSGFHIAAEPFAAGRLGPWQT